MAWLDGGGMGDVYRARDPRLRRDVAVKVLKPEIAVTPEHAERLGLEARAAGGLNHPNIVAVFDVGTELGTPYVVSELLEGESLRRRLEHAPLSYRKALEYGIQVAQALGAAHAKGICHRDVKPENVFLTSDGRAKLLDFGLAKLRKTNVDPEDSTADMTSPGSIHGTFGYMSPEQALGEPVDDRSDLFSFGAMLYEMFTGARAFRRESAAETIRAVVHEEPTDPRVIKPTVTAAAAAVVRRCLEKSRHERFQSARDLAFHLQQLLDAQTAVTPVSTVRKGGSHRFVAGGLALAIVAAGLLVARWPRPRAATFEQITFHRGRIGGARFASGGQAIVYSQALPGLAGQANTPEVWLRLQDSPESRPLGYTHADVLAAHGGVLALSMRPRFEGGQRFLGTLAEASLGGGNPRELLDNVEAADWDASGVGFVVVRAVAGGPSRIEDAQGGVLYQTDGCIRHLRVARDGRRIAFLEDAAGVGFHGRVAVVDRNAPDTRKFLTDEWPNASGLAWSPDGDEIWFTAAEGRENRALRAVDLAGRMRRVFQGPGSLTLWDTAPDGRVLLSREEERWALVGVPPGETAERDLSWFDTSRLGDLSADGRTILFEDRFGVYVRPTDGRPPVYLGLKEGWVDDLSADGRLALATTSSATQLVILPLKAGDPRPLPRGNIVRYRGSLWFPDGRRIMVNGNEAGRPARAYLQDLPDGLPRAFTPESTWIISISTDGRWAAGTGGGQAISIWPVDGGSPREVPGSGPSDRPVGFTADGRSLWVWRRNEVPARVFRVDVNTGSRHPWRTLVPRDPAGVYSIIELQVTPSGDAYFYGYARVLSELYVAAGLR